MCIDCQKKIIKAQERVLQTTFDYVSISRGPPSEQCNKKRQLESLISLQLKLFNGSRRVLCPSCAQRLFESQYIRNGASVAEVLRLKQTQLQFNRNKLVTIQSRLNRRLAQMRPMTIAQVSFELGSKRQFLLHMLLALEDRLLAENVHCLLYQSQAGVIYVKLA